MAESHVVSGLVAKRSELSGQIMHHQEVMRQLSVAIGNIDGAIKLFDPDYDLRTIKAKAPKQGNPWFEHGETNRMVLDALRTAAQPLSTRQIGEAMVSLKDVAVESIKDWDLVMKLVLAAARRLERKGIIKMAGRIAPAGRGNAAILWQIA